MDNFSRRELRFPPENASLHSRVLPPQAWVCCENVRSLIVPQWWVETSEESLLKAYCASQVAWDRQKLARELYQKYASVIWEIARSLCTHDEDFADISQMASLAFMEALELYRSVEIKPRDFAKYIQQTMLATVRTTLRQDDGHSPILSVEAVNDQGEAVDRTEDALWMGDILAIVRRNLASKNPNTYRDGRLVCLLQMLQGFSEKEIVESASVSRQAIQKQIRDVRQYLRSQIDHQAWRWRRKHSRSRQG